jgi:hypothetical protein
MILRKKIIINLVFLLTNSIFIYRYITEENSWYATKGLIILGLTLATILLGFKFLWKRENLKLYSILVLCIIVMIMKAFIYDNLSIPVLINLIVSTTLGTIIAGNGLNKFYQLFFMLVVHLYVAYSYAIGITPSELLLNYSHNHISVILLYSTILFYLSHSSLDIKTQKYSILPAISCLLLSTFSVGRSGMLSSFILVLFLTLLKYQNQIFHNKNFYIKLSYFLSSFLLTYGLYSLFSYAEKEGYFSRFEERGLESQARQLIIYSYIENIDGLSFILGNTSGFFQENTGLSAHISYLGLHNHFGVASILLIAYICYTLIQYYKFNKYYMSLLTVILIRSFTDDVLMSGGVMFGILLVILLLSCRSAEFKLDFIHFGFN